MASGTQRLCQSNWFGSCWRGRGLQIHYALLSAAAPVRAFAPNVQSLKDFLICGKIILSVLSSNDSNKGKQLYHNRDPQSKGYIVEPARVHTHTQSPPPCTVHACSTGWSTIACDPLHSALKGCWSLSVCMCSSHSLECAQTHVKRT